MSFKKDKKDDESLGNIFVNLDKSTVLQEARCFNDSPLNAKRCISILSKILYIIARGDKLSTTEATDTFFAITKLFQNRDLTLRRMVYIVIKEMSNLTDDVIIVTSSLQKDINDNTYQLLRAPALRALCKILQGNMPQMLERHLKEGIVSKSSPLASGAIVSCYHLIRTSPELIRSCTNEVQEAAASDKQMVQYHALGLLYDIRKQGAGSVVQMLQRYIKTHVKSSYAHCLLIRMIFKQLNKEETARDNEMLEFLDSSLRHRSEMVVYEAARAIVNLRNVSNQRLTTAINVFQVFCSSPKAVMRYAAVRTLNSVAMRMPTAAINFNTDLESLISDSNRSIATLAITTLLKVGNEHNVDRLIKQISTFMNDISDEFKIVVVESIKNLASKYPNRYQSMLGFLSSLLRDNDGYKFKKVVVMTMESIIREIPEAKSAGLLQLCEFIEDCEHMKLTQRILYLIGQEGPYLPNSRKFIRYIYNRIMLEDAPIRCTATIALAKFGAQIPELLSSVLVLLKRITLDEDDEVRDRAQLMLYLLQNQNLENRRNIGSTYILSEMKASPSALERMLRTYHQSTASNQHHQIPFDLKQVPEAATLVPGSGSATAVLGDVSINRETDPSGLLPDDSSVSAMQQDALKARAAQSNQNLSSAQLHEVYIEELGKVSEFDSLGPLFKSSVLINLNEDDLNVSCVKHIFENHCVIQYNCTNTMKSTLLEDVKLVVQEPVGDGMLEDNGSIGCPRLEYEVPGAPIYQVVEFFDLTTCMASVRAQLLFKMTEFNSDGSEASVSCDENYPIEDVEIELTDCVMKIVKPNFDAAWNDLGDDNERAEQLSFGTMTSIEDLVKKLEEKLGLHACEGTGQVDKSRSSHVLLLAGKYRNGSEVLMNIKIVKTGSTGLNVHFCVRSQSPEVVGVFVEALTG